MEIPNPAHAPPTSTASTSSARLEQTFSMPNREPYPVAQPARMYRSAVEDRGDADVPGND